MEDNPADVHLLRLALDQHGEEYRIELLCDGEEAIRFFQSQRTAPREQEPCVMVLDLHLPTGATESSCCGRSCKSRRWPTCTWPRSAVCPVK